MEPRGSLEGLVTARLDGPQNDASATDASAALEELVRLLNRATRRHPAMPPAVASVLGELAADAVRLDQLLGQLSNRLAVMAESSTVYDDRGQDPRDTAAAAVEALRQALPHVEALTRHLDLAPDRVAHMGGGADE